MTDYLSISFSSTDYVGHVFGPSSLEAEDNLLHLDRTLADLFAYIDREIGLDRTLIVLSADHGAPEAPATSASWANWAATSRLTAGIPKRLPSGSARFGLTWQADPGATIIPI